MYKNGTVIILSTNGVQLFMNIDTEIDFYTFLI